MAMLIISLALQGMATAQQCGCEDACHKASGGACCCKHCRHCLAPAPQAPILGSAPALLAPIIFTTVGPTALPAAAPPPPQLNEEALRSLLKTLLEHPAAAPAAAPPACNCSNGKAAAPAAAAAPQPPPDNSLIDRLDPLIDRLSRIDQHLSQLDEKLARIDGNASDALRKLDGRLKQLEHR
jgi:hypothetical protein